MVLSILTTMGLLKLICFTVVFVCLFICTTGQPRVVCPTMPKHIQEVTITDSCGKTISVDTAVSVETPWWGSFPVCTNCSLTLTSEKNQTLNVIVYSLNTLTGPKGQCTRNRIDIYDGAKVDHNMSLTGPGGLCGKTLPKKNYRSTNNSLTVKFWSSCDHGDFPYQQGSFQIIVAAFKNGNKSVCYGMFQCLNARCVNTSAVCDGKNQCGDNSDEKGCSIIHQPNVWLIVLIVLAALCALCLMILISIQMYRCVMHRGYQRV